eukprot:CAMPEP_0184500980 /NCGR_PEP_ID=MMETSP0113_2-20130426/46371_1 /TAXON_ID=91329 /ORGANISM="Norrisiella sphaerica, Strain BC52" /LENGTH=676 /DNA_ID=CAMNT_0026889581 /DNA_START=573 /DNA_END=2603 /DNA_ORIENTATION=+
MPGEAAGRETYWKDGFYTNWTMGNLLDGEKAERERAQDPQVVISKSKGIIVKIAEKLKNFTVALFMLILKPWRIPGAFVNVCKHIQHEIVHYSQGFRLFCADISTSVGLLKTFIKTGQLSWREKRQLTRAISDVFRLVPMAVFLLVPLFEFLLPLALKIFPEMLPSQFHKTDAKEAQLKKELKFRLRTAAFLQDTIDGIVKNKKLKDEGQLLELLDDVQKGRRVSNQDIIKVAHLFDDTLTLDNLEHIHLASMCRMLGVSPLGPSTFLRKKLLKKLKALKKDDIEISQMGVDNMNLDELKTACRERGMRTLGLTLEGYRRNLKSWLNLSMENDIPASLLLMSRAFTILERNPNPEEALRDALKNVDQGCVEEILYDAGLTVDTKKKLELIANQNALIKRELEEEAKLPSLADRKNKLGDGPSAGELLAKLELIESSKVKSDEISEKQLRELAEELESLVDDPFVYERDLLKKFTNNTGASPEEAKGRISAAAAKARAVADEKPSGVTVMSNSEDNIAEKDIPKIQIENAPFKIPDSTAEMERAGIVMDKPDVRDDDVNREKEQMAQVSDSDSLLERRLKGRLKNVIDKIEKRIEAAERIEATNKEEVRVVLDEDHDGRVSKEEIVKVLTDTLVEFKDHPEAAKKVAETLVKRCGNWAGEVSVPELIALARESREQI